MNDNLGASVASTGTAAISGIDTSLSDFSVEKELAGTEPAHLGWRTKILLRHKDAHRVGRHGAGEWFVCCGDQVFTVRHVRQIGRVKI